MIYLVFFAWSVSPHGTIEISLTQSPSVDHAFYEIPNHRTIAVKLINLSHLCTYCCGVSCSVSFFSNTEKKSWQNAGMNFQNEISVVESFEIRCNWIGH